MNTFDDWKELDLLTGLIYGEARGEVPFGRLMVGTVALTRSEHPGHWGWGNNLKDVILKPCQFSCYDLDNINRIKIVGAKKAESAEWRACQKIALTVMEKKYNIIEQPTHYHTTDVEPVWAKKLKYLFAVGKHKFYTCFGGDHE